MTDDDRLIRDYLRRLRRATRGLPRSRRQELLSEIASHIAEARTAYGPATASPAGPGETAGQAAPGQAAPGQAARAEPPPSQTGPSQEGPGEAAGPGVTGRPAASRDPVPAILARLGEPADIARAAGGPQLASRAGGLEIAAVILLLVGGFAIVIGWLVGCVLLWVSPRWRWTDKLLGTLVWPGGLALPFFLATIPYSVQGQACGTAVLAGQPEPVTCTPPNPGTAAWLGIGVLVVLLAGPALVAMWLLRRARRLPDQSATGQSASVPVH